jgi:hypothetical protein
MIYYRCSLDELHLEAQHRGYTTLGSPDQISEALEKDDNNRGTEATTVATRAMGLYVPRQHNLMRTSEFGQSVPARLLVDESKLCHSSAPRCRARILTMSRNCVLDDEHIFPDPPAIFRIRPLMYH